MDKNEFKVTLIFKIIIGFARKLLIFVGKHSNFYSKDICFFFCIFCLNEETLTQQVCTRKYVENKIFNLYLSQNKKIRRRAKI